MNARARTTGASPESRQTDRGRSLARPGRLGGLLATLVLCSGLQAQSSTPFGEVGRLYVQNFAPEDYGAHSQNFAVAQHETGLIYVGNGAGVLEYDGVSWRLIPISNNSLGRSLAIDSEGRIFVGAMGELGYLAADALGRQRFVSLLEHIPEEDRDFTDVWNTHALPEGVYFQTRHSLFRWKDGQMKVWRWKERIAWSFVIRDILYVSKRGQGFVYVDRDDKLRPVPGGEAFAEFGVVALLAHGTDASLVVTRRRGVLRCRGSAPALLSCVSFSPDLTDLLRKLQPYHASVLPDGRVALGTATGGLVLLDRSGHLLRILNQASGLLAEKVLYTFVDRQDGLWLGLGSGLSRVEVTARLSYFDRTTGLGPGIRNVMRHRGRLYATIGRGLQVLEPAAEGAAAHFVNIPGSAEYCMPLLTTPQGLLVGCQNGIYDVEQLRRIQELPDIAFTLYLSKRDPTRLYAGLTAGLSRLELRGGAWQDAGRVDGVREQIRSIVEDTQGRLWLGTPISGVLRVEAPYSDEPIVSRFGVAEGLPTGWNHVYTLAGRVVVLSPATYGLFRAEPRGGSVVFAPDTTFDAFLPQGSGSITDLAEDEQGRVWILAGTASGVAVPQGDDNYSWEPTRLRRGATEISTGPYVEPGGPLWVYPGLDRLLRFDPAGSPESPTGYKALIRRVTTPGDTLHFDGQVLQPRTAQVWPHRAAARRFEYAAPFFDASDRTRFRTRLDGFNDDWSAWSAETHKEYTNLWEGRYVFRVEARDVYGFISREDSFAFRILPPWYRRWWAYSLYGLALAAVVLALVRLQRNKLRRERAVSARLRAIDKLKDEFLANTSHELRTPLFGITGLAESLVDGAAGELPEAAVTNLSMIVGSGRRLGRLVGDILDYSRLTHDSLVLRRRPVDLRSLTEVVLALNEPLAAGKDVELRNAVPDELPAADADEARLEQILHNLVGNAVKFTESGWIEVAAEAVGARIVVRVTDTGIGIAPDDQEQIFLSFEQVEPSAERHRIGTGLGLAVTRKLVELHGGRIEVRSSPGEGSTFSFNLEVAELPAAVSPDPQPRADAARPVFVSPEESSATITLPLRSSPGTEQRAHDASILVVDDEPVNLQVMSNYLAAVGFRLTLASSGEEALSLFEEDSSDEDGVAKPPFDLVLLDVMMPRMSGFEVSRLLREKYPMERLPIVFLSAMDRLGDRVAGLDQGGNDYLTKPIAKSELLSRVYTHLELLEALRLREQEVETLRGLLPICVRCKKIRDDEGEWNEIEAYIGQRSEAAFSHGICPVCTEELYPGLLDDADLEGS